VPSWRPLKWFLIYASSKDQWIRLQLRRQRLLQLLPRATLWSTKTRIRDWPGKADWGRSLFPPPTSNCLQTVLHERPVCPRRATDTDKLNAAGQMYALAAMQLATVITKSFTLWCYCYAQVLTIKNVNVQHFYSDNIFSFNYTLILIGNAWKWHIAIWCGVCWYSISSYNILRCLSGNRIHDNNSWLVKGVILYWL
jgi:hypothetical protein